MTTAIAAGLPRASASPTSAFHASLRPSDVFICSFPKSGTTWVGYLLAQVLRTPGDQRQLGLNSFNDYVPDVNLLYGKRAPLAGCESLPDPRVLLCHAVCDLQLPRVIYVLRDPRDAVVSYWHYQKFLSKSFNLSLHDFIAHGKHWPCEWDQHVAGWLLPRRHPDLLVVCYEQMHRDPATVLRQMLDFAGIGCADDRITAAIEASRFDRMRAAEEKFGVADKAGDAAERFVRKGRVGGGREELSPADLRLLEEKYGQVMQQVGYQRLT